MSKLTFCAQRLLQCMKMTDTKTMKIDVTWKISKFVSFPYTIFNSKPRCMFCLEESSIFQQIDPKCDEVLNILPPSGEVNKMYQKSYTTTG